MQNPWKFRVLSACSYSDTILVYLREPGIRCGGISMSSDTRANRRVTRVLLVTFRYSGHTFLYFFLVLGICV